MNRNTPPRAAELQRPAPNFGQATTTDSRPKIFCVGIQRTGTTSLADALTQLGFRTSHWWEHEEIRDGIRTGIYRLPLMERFDAVGDWPIPLIYKELDAAFPEGLFILTLRDRDEWLNSVTRHMSGRSMDEEEELFYGRKHFDPDVALRRYDEHNANVQSYFAQRDDFLVMDIPGGDGWGKLAPFCGCAIPPAPFPSMPARYPRFLARPRLAIGRVTARLPFRSSW